MLTLRRLRRVLGILLIGAVLVAQPGCAFLLGQAAVAGGKHVYKKMKEDKAQKDAAKQGPEGQEEGKGGDEDGAKSDD